MELKNITWISLISENHAQTFNQFLDYKKFNKFRQPLDKLYNDGYVYFNLRSGNYEKDFNDYVKPMYPRYIFDIVEYTTWLTETYIKVGKKVMITRGTNNFNSSMGVFVGKEVVITKANSNKVSIEFYGCSTWSWRYDQNHFRITINTSIKFKKSITHAQQEHVKIIKQPKTKRKVIKGGETESRLLGIQNNKIVTKENLINKALVVRGKDWKWDTQDNDHFTSKPTKGIINSLGTGDGWISVKWHNGSSYYYRIGAEGSFDLYYLNDNLNKRTVVRTKEEKVRLLRKS